MDTPQTQIRQKIALPQNTFSQQPNLIDTLFRWSIKNRNRIIFVFKLYYYLLILLTIAGSFSAYYLDKNFLFFYDLALWSGKIGLTFYVLTVIPGVARRFGIKHKVISLLMIFRRYTGISMYLGVFAHFMVIRGTLYIRQMRIVWPMPTFELLSLTALVLTTFLFLTSNDYSVFRLKKLWNKVHQLTYVIIWLIAFHVLLQRISVWSILISTAVVLQVASYIYSRFIRSTPVTNTSSPQSK